MKYLNLTSLTAIGLVLAACGGSGGNDSTTPPPPPPPMNTAPVADAGSATLLQNAEATEITLVATDADGDALTYSVNTQPSSGSLTISGNIASYTPNTDFSGMDSFTFLVNDGTVNSTAATIDLTVQPTSSFEGKTQKSDGTRASNITVSALDGSGEVVTTAISDGDGEFTLTAVTAQELVLNFSSPDYADQVLPVTMPELKSIVLPLDITVIERGAVQTIDIDAGGTLGGDSGANVTLTAGSFVDANGAAVTGSIDAQITPVDISNGQTLAAFPGDFTGVEELSGNETTIASLGTVEYIFTQNGEPLQLGNGATAEIEMPLFSAIHPETGDTIELGDEIALWSLNEDTGIWAQEGTGTVVANLESPTGLALRATVSHFTWWNIDVAISTATVNVTVDGTLDGVAAIIGKAQTKRGFRTANTSVEIGNTRSGMFVPADTEVCIWIEYVNSMGASAVSDEQCITPIANSSNNLTFLTQEEGPLDLRDSDIEATYFVGDPLSVSVDPLSLETSVSYVVSASTLPAGLSLSANSATSTQIIGIPTIIGTSTVTIEGTDSDNFTDSQTLTFEIIDTPPPSLAEPATLYASVGDSISQAITINDNGGDEPTSWIITQADGSAAPAGVSISAGVFSVDSFDVAEASYLVTAFNSKGGSNTVPVEIIDIATVPPVLQSQLDIDIIIEFNTGQEVVDLPGDGIYTGAPTTSWTIAPQGNVGSTSASITNAGVLTVDGFGDEGDFNSYSITALVGTIASNVMTLNVNLIDICTQDQFSPSCMDDMCAITPELLECGGGGDDFCLNNPSDASCQP